MKSSEKTIIKDFKAVDFMRKTRDKISSEIADMTFEEIKDGRFKLQVQHLFF